VLGALEDVSAAWLAEHEGRERHFSQGFFDRGHIADGPVAVLRRAERIMAFATLWLSADGTEASVDLVRFTRDAAEATMGFLVAEVMLWARDRGCRWFVLGVAPSPEVADHRLAVLWPPRRRPLLRHGAQFHDARGLRAFMEKLDPVWEPVFLLHPARALPEVLADLTTLIEEQDGLAGR
jgi:phosphatidylglycerol lysyltransferase